MLLLQSHTKEDLELLYDFHEDCWACRLALGMLDQHKTEWFYRDAHGAVVEDLNPKEYDLRLLYVPVEHFECGSEPLPIHGGAAQVLYGVANALAVQRGYVISTDDDFYDHSYTAHWHAQVGLWKSEKVLPSGMKP